MIAPNLALKIELIDAYCYPKKKIREDIDSRAWQLYC